LLGILIAALLPRFVVKFVYQYYSPDDIQISREVEKARNLRINGDAQIEMFHISNPQR
jgi:phospholipid-transporting ATPase